MLLELLITLFDFVIKRDVSVPYNFSDWFKRGKRQPFVSVSRGLRLATCNHPAGSQLLTIHHSRNSATTHTTFASGQRRHRPHSKLALSCLVVANHHPAPVSSRPIVVPHASKIKPHTQLKRPTANSPKSLRLAEERLTCGPNSVAHSLIGASKRSLSLSDSSPRIAEEHFCTVLHFAGKHQCALRHRRSPGMYWQICFNPSPSLLPCLLRCYHQRC